MMLPFAIAIGIFLASLVRRDVGLLLCLLALPTYLVRTTLVGIPTTALELSIYGVVAAWLVRDVYPKRSSAFPALPRTFLVLTAAWVAAWMLSAWFSTDREASLGAVKAWLIDPLLFGLVFLSVVTTFRRLRMLIAGIAGSGLIVALVGIYQYVFQHASLQDGRLSSFFHPVANYAAMYLAPIVIITLGALMWKLIHRAWWLALFVMVVALALTVSFGGFLSVGIGVLCLLWCWPNRRQQIMMLVGLGATALLGFGLIAQTPYLAEKLNTTDRSSSLVRTQIWRTSMEMIRERPWFGVGPNAYEPIYRETVPKLYWPPLEWLVSQPHQLGLALWLETGILGFFVLLGTLVWWVRMLWPRLAGHEPIVVIAVATITAILAHGFVDTPLFKNDLMILFVVPLLFPLLSFDKNKLTY